MLGPAPAAAGAKVAKDEEEEEEEEEEEDRGEGREAGGGSQSTKAPNFGSSRLQISRTVRLTEPNGATTKARFEQSHGREGGGEDDDDEDDDEEDDEGGSTSSPSFGSCNSASATTCQMNWSGMR